MMVMVTGIPQNLEEKNECCQEKRQRSTRCRAWFELLFVLFKCFLCSSLRLRRNISLFIWLLLTSRLHALQDRVLLRSWRFSRPMLKGVCSYPGRNAVILYLVAEDQLKPALFAIQWSTGKLGHNECEVCYRLRRGQRRPALSWVDQILYDCKAFTQKREPPSSHFHVCPRLWQTQLSTFTSSSISRFSGFLELLRLL